jgi:hypothetical protein
MRVRHYYEEVTFNIGMKPVLPKALQPTRPSGFITICVMLP